MAADRAVTGRDWRNGAGLAIGSIGVFAAAWMLADGTGLTARLGFSTLPQVVEGLSRAWGNQDFSRDFWASVQRLLPGVSAGMVLGWVVGLATGRCRALSAVASGYLDTLRALPAIALAPFFLTVFGVGEGVRIFTIAFGSFFPIWVATHEGARRIDQKYLDLATVLRLNKWRRLRYVIAPATIPFVVAGMRISISTAFVMLFISEWLGATAGLGYRASHAYNLSDTWTMVLGLLELGLLALLADLGARGVAWVALPWLRVERNE